MTPPNWNSAKSHRAKNWTHQPADTVDLDRVDTSPSSPPVIPASPEICPAPEQILSRRREDIIAFLPRHPQASHSDTRCRLGLTRVSVNRPGQTDRLLVLRDPRVEHLRPRRRPGDQTARAVSAARAETERGMSPVRTQLNTSLGIELAKAHGRGRESEHMDGPALAGWPRRLRGWLAAPRPASCWKDGGYRAVAAPKLPVVVVNRPKNCDHRTLAKTDRLDWRGSRPEVRPPPRRTHPSQAERPGKTLARRPAAGQDARRRAALRPRAWDAVIGATYNRPW